MLAAFAGQALASLIVWLLVNDKSREGAWSNVDFGQWIVLSLACAAMVTMAFAVATWRWGGVVAVVTGCALAVGFGGALFVGYAVLNSA